MVLITFSPWMARLLIHPRERRKDYTNIETLEFLEGKIAKGEWEKINPIWITPNLIGNSLMDCIECLNLPSIKPFNVYNGHNRRYVAIKHGLPLKAYVRYTPGNPKMPREEELVFDICC